MKKILKRTVSLISVIACANSFALPIDWTGNIGFDQNIIEDVRGTNGSCTVTNGSECLTDDNKNARFQTLLLKLNPNMIVNDSVTIKGELSTGSIRGSFNTDNSNNGTENSYFAQSAAGSSLNINQIYAELYADTALFRIGKYARHYGLGAVISSGDRNWDRFFSSYEGAEAEFKLGNFKLIPSISVLDSDGTGVNTETRNSGKYDTTEQSVTAIYDNSNRDLKVGIFYGVRKVETNSDLNGANAGPQKTTIIDIFFEKTWGAFNLGLEIPLVSGEVGKAYNPSGTEDQDFSGKAVIMEASYDLNPKWKFGLHAGSVSGSDSDEDSQEAMYLHPNYQIAEIMFRYNREGFQSQTENAYRSNIVNTNYAKVFAHYQNEAWSWRLDIIMATAQESAQEGNTYYSHKDNTYQVANDDQENDLGIEYDIAFDYRWSPSVTVSGYIGYYQVGEFYAFTNNTSEKIEVSNITASGLRVNVGF